MTTPNERFTDKRGNRMINKSSLVWLALIGMLLIAVTNWNTYARGKSAGYWVGYNAGLDTCSKQHLHTNSEALPSHVYEDDSFGDVYDARNPTYTAPIIIGPSTKYDPGVALYVHGEFIQDCFGFGQRAAVPFTGFLNNNGTVSPTTLWLNRFCGFDSGK